MNHFKIKIIFLLFLCSIFFSCYVPEKDGQKENKCTTYACPMHPDKTSIKPATCSECTMEMKISPDSIATDSVVAQSGCKANLKLKS